MTFQQLNFNQAKEIVSIDGSKLNILPECFKNNFEIVRIAIINSLGYDVLRFASPALKNNYKIVSIAVKRWGCALQYASERLRNNKRIVMFAVREHGVALEYASDRLRNDKEVVMIAISEHDQAIYYASENLRGDREVIYTATSISKYYSIAISYASKDLQNDKDLILYAITHNAALLQYASPTLLNDREVIFTAISRNGQAICYASENLRGDKELALLAISNTISNHFYSPDYYYDSYDKIWKEPIISFLSGNLRHDIDVVIAAVKNDKNSLDYITTEFIVSNYKVVVYAINIYGTDMLNYVPCDNYIDEKLIQSNPPLEEDHEYELHYNDEMCEDTYSKFYNHIKENIQRYENFSVFLQGVCIPKSQSTLQKYDFFHSVDFLKSIADFTGTIISANDYYIYKSVSQQLGLS